MVCQTHSTTPPLPNQAQEPVPDPSPSTTPSQPPTANPPTPTPHPSIPTTNAQVGRSHSPSRSSNERGGSIRTHAHLLPPSRSPNERGGFVRTLARLPSTLSFPKRPVPAPIHPPVPQMNAESSCGLSLPCPPHLPFPK